MVPSRGRRLWPAAAVTTACLLLSPCLASHGGTRGGSLPELASEDPEVAAAVAEEVESRETQAIERCGITGILEEHGELMFGKTEAVCNRPMSTNCTISYSTIQCPSGCPYLAPSRTFACFFECVPADTCSSVNPEMALPNEESHMCAKCDLKHCQRCKSQSACDECYEGFVKVGGEQGTCEFELEQHTHFRLALKVVLGTLISIVVLAVVWRLLYGLPEYSAQNNASIRRAMRHRHMTKVQNWNLKEDGEPRVRYDLRENVHKKHIVGVGLPLFYNNLCFLMFMGLIFWITTYIVYATSEVPRLLGSLASGNDQGYRLQLVHNAMDLPDEYPAMVVSPLAICSRHSSTHVAQAMKQYAWSNVYALGFLYVIAFAVSLMFARYQKHHSDWFDSLNDTMADYALCLNGLPKDATDEAELKAWAEGVLARCAEWPGCSNEPLTVVGVSIGYDYTHCEEQVNDMIFRLTENIEVDMDLVNQDLTTVAAMDPPKSIEEMEKEDRKTVKAWFDPNSKTKLESSGEVFVVLEHKVSKRDVLFYNRQNPGAIRYKDIPIQVNNVHVEPVSACWWHFGCRSLVLNLCIACAKILAWVVGVLSLSAVFAKYIVMPYVNEGNTASGSMFMVAGFLLGWVNMLVSIQIYFISYGLGFHRKDKRDIVIFWANLIMSMLNVSFQIYVTAMQVYNKAAIHTTSFFKTASLMDLDLENGLAHNVWMMLIPGMFFTGYVMCPIMAGVVPYLWNMLLMKVIYVWACLPRCLLHLLKLFLPWAPRSLTRYPARNAEKGLEGMELGLPWDYAASIMLPTICCLTLVLVSPCVWKIFRGLCLWAVFYYGYCRYMHLRFMRMQFFTTRRVDCMVNIAWGLPLSVVAMAWNVWAWRTGVLPTTANFWVKVLVCGGTGLMSFCLWLVSYLRWVRPFEFDFDNEENNMKISVRDVQDDTLYSWFNCNPVYCLKCKHLILHEDWQSRRAFDNPIACGQTEQAVRYFEVGKEYLFMHGQARMDRKVEAQQNCKTEFETYVDALVLMMEGEDGEFTNIVKDVRGAYEEVTDELHKKMHEMGPMDKVAGDVFEIASPRSMKRVGDFEAARPLLVAEATLPADGQSSA